MNTSSPSLSPIFRSDTQGEIMARLFLSVAGDGYTIADLARLSHAPYATAHREVQRLVTAGLLTEEQIGRARRVSPDRENRAFGPLVELLLLSYGPAVLLEGALGGIDDIETAYIYGSWAARRAGEEGSPPGDVDVVVIGNPPRSTIADTATEVEKRLGREVNIRIVSAAAWLAEEDLFITTLKSRPLFGLDLGGEE